MPLVIPKEMKGDATLVLRAFEQVGDEGFLYYGKKHTTWRWTSNYKVSENI